MDSAITTTTHIDAFLDQLANRGHIDALNRVSGTVELDIKDSDRRWLSVQKGDVRVSQNPVAADCLLACDAETFIGIVSGRINSVAAALRGSITISGDIALALAIRRLGMDGNERE